MARGIICITAFSICFMAVCFHPAMTTAATTENSPSVPLIDLEPWFYESATGPAARDEVVRQVAEACRSVGFFMIQNHGMNEGDEDSSSNVLQEAWEASQSFFDLPTQEKLHHKTSNEAEYPYGYEQSEQLAKGKKLDGSLKETETTEKEEESPTDLKETFAIGPNNLQSGMPLRRWIDTPLVPTFRPALEAYYSKMEDLANALLQIFALALELPIDYFEDKMDRHMSALRLVHYYPLSSSSSNDNNNNNPGREGADSNHMLVRAGAHTDYGALTILNAKSSGLQVLLRQEGANETAWYSVPVVPGSLVINLGDLMQRWTNDKWVSTLHRVVMPSTDAMERRYSMAYFVNVNGDTLIKPLESCLDKEQETSYHPILARDHLMAKHLASMDESPVVDHEEL